MKLGVALKGFAKSDLKSGINGAERDKVGLEMVGYAKKCRVS